MSLRRQNMKSILYMALLAMGMLVVGRLIFRGAGTPRESARVVAPADRVVRLESAGRYIVIAEQVVAPQPISLAEAGLPEISLKMSDPSGATVSVYPAGIKGWFFKFLTKQQGHTLGVFNAPTPGEYRVRADMAEIAGRKPDLAVILAFAPAASSSRFLWLLLGFGGQIFFSLRFLVQWLASEKAGRVTVPRAFWYYSMIGGLMVLTYAVHTRDPVFILAYAFNAFIYLRNLALLNRASPTPQLGGLSVSKLPEEEA
jgi:lipid-A-disaccharide synthase-like uncharacterized protein